MKTCKLVLAIAIMVILMITLSGCGTTIPLPDGGQNSPKVVFSDQGAVPPFLKVEFVYLDSAATTTTQGNSKVFETVANVFIRKDSGEMELVQDGSGDVFFRNYKSIETRRLPIRVAAGRYTYRIQIYNVVDLNDHVVGTLKAF